MIGKLVEVSQITKEEKKKMYHLMDEFYDHMSEIAFNRDLSEKEYCIILMDDAGEIKGFSTQKMMTFSVNGEIINGVFSGDTIIHKDHWGSLDLFKVFAQKFVEYGKQFPSFYWFLISKGYKTYKMLPLFFNEFYPNYRAETPELEQSIMHTFGKLKYPDEYEKSSGVVCYASVKDKVKDGVADICERHMKNKDISFFTSRNPGYIRGNDLVCIANLHEHNLKETAKRLLLEATQNVV